MTFIEFLIGALFIGAGVYLFYWAIGQFANDPFKRLAQTIAVLVGCAIILVSAYNNYQSWI